MQGDIETFLRRRQAAGNAKEQYKVDKALPRIMKEASALELGASEYDLGAHPIQSRSTLDWRNFNTDMYSTDRSYTEIADVADNNLDK